MRRVKTFNVTSYKNIERSKIAFDVPEMEAEYVDGVMRLYATVVLPKNMAGATVNQVWQVGSSVTNGIPNVHGFGDDNLGSKGTLDLMSGQSNRTQSRGGNSNLKKRNIHGILNAVSWGILFPIGAIFARYLRTFKLANPAWFYLHIFCQSSSYVIGVVGWATGLQLEANSKGLVYKSHRNIGITLFCFATLQIFALFLRPKKEHKYRIYWNFYHHIVGYSILVLGIVNVFKGLDMLDPAKMLKTAYIVVLCVLGGIALVLEVMTWIVVLKRKSEASTEPYDGNGKQQPLTV